MKNNIVSAFLSILQDMSSTKSSTCTVTVPVVTLSNGVKSLVWPNITSRNTNVYTQWKLDSGSRTTTSTATTATTANLGTTATTTVTTTVPDGTETVFSTPTQPMISTNNGTLYCFNTVVGSDLPCYSLSSFGVCLGISTVYLGIVVVLSGVVGGFALLLI